MNAGDLRAQIEEEMSWRIEEILFFQNYCASILDEEKRNKFRRALVLLLYANFEGFCRFALSLYVSAINASGIECKQASHAVAAASLDDVFGALRNSSSKAIEFRNKLPDDAKLHRFAREKEFIERAALIMNRPVAIPDSVVDTESNLKSAVLRKILYRLGLPFDQFAEFEPEVDTLLAVRNKIAHGETRAGITFKLYEQLRSSALRVMSGISASITIATDEKWYMTTMVGTTESIGPIGS